MAQNWVDRCIFQATSGGTGPFVSIAAVQGYLTPSQAGATDGSSYHYAAQPPGTTNPTEWEIGTGVYSAGSQTLTRATVEFNSDGTHTPHFFSVPPQVLISTNAADIIQATQQFTGVLPGQVPASGGGTTNFLRADGTWAQPATSAETLTFSTPAVAQLAAIPASTNYIQVQGLKTPGDGGAGTFARVGFTWPLPTVYAGYGWIPQLVPAFGPNQKNLGTPQAGVVPGFTTGGLPVLVFSITSSYGPGVGPIPPYIGTTKPILPGVLAFIVCFDELETGSTFASSVTDSAGNTYTLAVASAQGTNGFTCIYYCSNPVAAPVGTTFNFSNFTASRIYHVYTCPGFSGAVLDKTGTAFSASPAAGSFSVSSPALTTSPELVIGAINANKNGILQLTDFGLFSTPPSGWFDLTPPIFGRNAVACTVPANPSAITYTATYYGADAAWSGSNSLGVIATFRTFPLPTLANVSFWQLQPTFPLHTAAYGIDPTVADNLIAFETFGQYLATIAPASGGSFGSTFTSNLGPTPPGVVTISIANPAVITWDQSNGPFQQPLIRNGSMVSFSTTGQLPAPLVPGQIYYVLYGTIASVVNNVNPFIPNTITFQICMSPLFQNPTSIGIGGTVNQDIFPWQGPISTLGGAQSGTHTITTYGEDWVDVVLDPGTYAASFNYFPVMGWGLKKARVYGAGARLLTNADIGIAPWLDQNATNNNSTHFTFSCAFQTTNARTTGNNQNYITLVNGANINHFYVNSWVLLMCLELQQSDSGNWNEYTFEFAKVQALYPSGNANLLIPANSIAFYDRLQFNYKSTYPTFRQLSGSNFGVVGPATIVQLNDTFDQEFEVHGMNFYGVTEETVGLMAAIRFFDCEFFGWGFKSGPSPVCCREYTNVRCHYHNCTPEVDKLIDLMQFIDCTFDETSYLLIQSASINKCIMERCRFGAGMSGTPKDLTMRDCFMRGQFQIGPVYGGTERILLENCHIQRVTTADQESEPLGVNSTTFSNGTIKIAAGTTTIYGTWGGASPPDICPAPWAAPGAKVLVTTDGSITTAGSLAPIGLSQSPFTVFVVEDVYVDGSNNFLIDTNIRTFPTVSVSFTATVTSGVMNVTGGISPAGACLLRGMVVTGGTLPANTTITTDLGIPNATSNLGNYTLSSSSTFGSTTLTATIATANVIFLPHPCPRLTVINCTGGRFVTDMAGSPPDTPMYSYIRRMFVGMTGALVTGADSRLQLFGNLVSLTINVLVPYNGADSAAWTMNIYIFGWAISAGVTYPTWIQQTINVKTAGIRSWAGTASPTGSQTGDTIVAIPFWIAGDCVVTMGNPTFVFNGADHVSNLPQVLVTAQTDQGINYATLSLNTQNTAQDEYADTTTGATTT